MTEAITLKEFTRRFHKLRDSGFVRSQRRGPTGVGHTLEACLRLQENNLVIPDVGFAELKAHRSDSSSMVTLFTFNRKVWKVDCLEVVKAYGSVDRNGRIGLYYTMGPVPNSAGLFVKFERHSVDLRHIDGTLLASWPLAEIMPEFQANVPPMVYVIAEVERRETDYFRFCRARKLISPRFTTMSFLYSRGDVALDFRIGGRKSDRIDFLVKESELPEMFGDVEDI
jgi:hypothetical protein